MYRNFTKTHTLVFVLLIVSAFTAAGQDLPNCSEANGLKSSEVKELVKVHRSSRDGVDLPPLTWDCGLAARAQATADSTASGSSTAPGAGENRFSSYDSSVDVRTTLALWREERRDWDAKAGTCETGRICNHWTQMVAPLTTRFGCGINRKGKGSSKAVLVCLYDPARQ